MKKKLCLNFSGGRTSAFMTWWCLRNLKDEYDMIVVFDNTGREREETLEFADKCDKFFCFDLVWVEAVVHMNEKKATTHKVVSFETASRNGEPFEAVIQKYGMPDMNFPHCSRELKTNVTKSYLKSIGWNDCYNAVGIRADEPARLNWAKASKNKIIYPLATMIHTVKSDVNRFFSNMPFDLELTSYQGNCDLCFKKSSRKLMTIVNEKPELADWWRKMESKYENYIPESRQGKEKRESEKIRFFRDNMSIDEIIEEARFEFLPAKDESKIIDQQVSMWDQHLDSNGGCVESCEAF